MNYSYGLPNFGTDQMNGSGAPFYHPPTHPRTSQDYVSNSYNHEAAPGPHSFAYQDMSLGQPTTKADLDTLSLIPHSNSAYDPSIYYDPRDPSAVISSTGVHPPDAPSLHIQQDENASDGISANPSDQGPYPSTLHRSEIAQTATNSKAPHDISDDEHEEGEVSEDGSPAPSPRSASEMLSTRPYIGAAGEAYDDIAERSLMDSQSLTRDLILEMHSWGVTFEDMVREVNHPEQLRASFLEAGLPVDLQSESKALRESASSGINKTAAHPQAHVNGQMQHTAASSLEKGPLSTTFNSGNTVPLQQTVVEMEMSTTTGEQRPLDRKALIAQKLAAKSALARASPATDRSLHDVPASTKRSEHSPSGSQASNSKQQTGSPSTPLSDLEAQKKAQTELARRRMEALKQKMAVKDASHQVSRTEQAQVEPEPNIPTPPALQTDIEPPKSVPPRKASYFSPVSQSQLFSIPGLMSAPNTFGEGELRQEPERDHQLNFHEATQISLPQPVFPEPAPLSRNPPLADQRLSSANPVETLSRPKRPEASDFIDEREAAKPNLLADGDAGVIIDISDEESDQSDEDLVSVTNKVRPVTPGATHDLGSSSSANIPRIHSASDRPRYGLNSSSSASGTPKTILTPRAQEDEDLKSKEFKIQSLTRKIAALEAKRHIKKEKTVSGTNKTANQAQETPSSQAPTQSQPGASFPGQSAATPLEKSQPLSRQPRPPDTKSEHLIRSTQSQTISDREFNNRTASVHPQAQSQIKNSGVVVADSVARIASERNISRNVEIRQGIPLLDREIERARSKLANLKQQETEIEGEIQRGLDGKRMLLEELTRLNPTDLDPREDAIHADVNETGLSTSKNSARNSAGIPKQDSSLLNPLVGLKPDVSMTEQPSDPLQLDHQVGRRASTSPKPDHASSAMPELDGHVQSDDIVMDISQSEAEDVEVDMSGDQQDEVDEDPDVRKGDSDHTSHPDQGLDDFHEDQDMSGEDPHEPIRSSGENSDLDDDDLSNFDPEEEPLFDFDDEEMYEPEANVGDEEPAERQPEGHVNASGSEPRSSTAPFDPLFDEMDISDDHQIEGFQEESENQGSEEEYEPPEPSKPPEDPKLLHVEEQVESNENPTMLPRPDDKPQGYENRATYFTPYESPLKNFKTRNPQSGTSPNS